jgi:beta-lactamase regulating signal transducer with metallopeptidase domain
MLETLGIATLQGLALLVAVALVCRVLRRLPSSYRQALWWTVCLKFPLGLLWIAPIAIPFLPASSAPYAVSAAVTTGSAAVAQRGVQAAQSSAPILPVLLLVAWALGVGVSLLRLTLDAVGLRRLVRRARPLDDAPLAETVRVLGARAGLRRSPRLAESDGVSSPMVVGLLRATIVLPAGFATAYSEPEREMALAHELAHLRRGDLWTGLVPTLARILFWFLPPVAWAAREWETEREAACDAEAIAATRAEAPDYGRLLLQIVAKDRRPASASALGATAGFHTLRRRLALVGQPDRPLPTFALIVPAFLFLPVQLVAPVTVGGLLLNSGIEEGERNAPNQWTRGPRIHSVHYVWDQDVAHSGRASLGIFKTDDRFFPIAEWSQSIPYRGEGSAIEVSAWVRAERMRKAVLDVQFVREDGIASHQWVAFVGEKQDGDAPANHDWKRLGGIVAIPPGTTEIVVAPQVYGPGRVWFDDIEAHFTNRAPTASELN